MIFWKLLYNVIIIPILWIVFHTGKFFNSKIQRGINGRKNLFQELENVLASFPKTQRIWFHASSLGEFEQAKPIIEKIKSHYPSVKIIATFFSPSGYENSKHYKFADVVMYIPFDSFWKVKKFINLLQPSLAIFIRYDIWPNIIWRLYKTNIPIILVNATMKQRTSRKVFAVRQFHTSLYNCFHSIFTITENDTKSFQDFRIKKPTIQFLGDTRFDRVIEKRTEAKTKHLFPNHIIKEKKIVVLGQTWEQDEEHIIPAILTLHQENSELLTIIVPHEPTLKNLEDLEYRLEKKISFIRFSDLNDYSNEKIIIVDSVGILTLLYNYATIAYIGGGFQQGVHNVLEPAVFGIPVLYGPKHTNSQEAIALAKIGGGFVINNKNEFYNTVSSLLHNSQNVGMIAKNFVEQQSGATERFITMIKRLL